MGEEIGEEMYASHAKQKEEIRENYKLLGREFGYLSPSSPQAV